MITASELIKKHEGVRYDMYLDTLGIPTIGVGFNLKRADALPRMRAIGVNLEAVMRGKTLSAVEVQHLFVMDLDDVFKDLRLMFVDYDSMPAEAQAVLADLRFNLGGTGLRRWPKTMAAFRAHDWKLAADQIEENKLWASQVGRRAKENVALMRSIRVA